MENLFGGHKAKVAAKNAGATKAEAKTAAKTARKTEVKKIVKSAGETLQNVGEDAAFAPILIFKPMMVKRLDAMNVPHTKMLSDIAKKFYDNVVSKSSFETFVSVGYNATIGQGIAEVALTGDPLPLVQAIIQWVKGLVTKKKLTPEDAQSKKEAEAATAAAVKATKKDSGGFFDMLLRLLGLKKKLPVT